MTFSKHYKSGQRVLTTAMSVMKLQKCSYVVVDG